MSDEEIRDKALNFFLSQKGGVISTLSGDQPEGAFVYYDGDEDFSVYFFTVVTTRKHLNIQAHNKVAFTIFSVKPPQTIQMEGTAEEVNDQVIIENTIGNYIDIGTYGMTHEAPITKLDWEKGIILYRIKPTWLRWSNYSDHRSKKKHSVSAVLIGGEPEYAYF